ncbi:hypothetical protein MHU86_10652 [Fragilaria crotonensis]|nr:hypothetical protein MHU86_10652 [Fragilaria crotonensis]
MTTIPNMPKEEALLDDVLAIYDKYEEDALVEQNRLRCKLTTCSKNKVASLQAQLSDAKIKCSLLKVLTLLLQSDSSRLKGRLHADRMELMQQVERVLVNINLLRQLFEEEIRAVIRIVATRPIPTFHYCCPHFNPNALKSSLCFKCCN